MKINIGPYLNWFGPYQLAEMLCFWVKPVKDEYGIPRKPDWVHNFGEWLAHGSIEPESKPGEIRFHRERKYTWLYRLLNWIHSKKERTVKIKIDKWDTWNMNDTLALIILPMLKQLKEQKHGAPYVDLTDVPKELHPKKMTKKQREIGHTDSTHFERWDYVLDEMIFAFEHTVDDSWEDQYTTGKINFGWKQLENGMSEMVEGPGHTVKTDHEGLKKVHDRIQNGFVLFGKYYRNLWD